MIVLMPRSVPEALEMLAEHENAVPMAGGTDLLVHWPVQFARRQETFVDLSKLNEIKPVRWTEDELVIGGLATYWDVIRDKRAWVEFPLLIDAARQIGAVQIQTRGTWAGNIVNASPAADGVPVLMAYDAEIELRSLAEVETVVLSEFYQGYKVMRRRPDQLVTEIRLPRRPYDLQRFVKVGSRRAQAITKVGLALTARGEEWRVVANSVAPAVCRCPAIERLVSSDRSVSSAEDLLPAIREDVSPIDDIRSTAEYREQVMARVLYDLLESHG